MAIGVYDVTVTSSITITLLFASLTALTSHDHHCHLKLESLQRLQPCAPALFLILNSATNKLSPPRCLSLTPQKTTRQRGAQNSTIDITNLAHFTLLPPPFTFLLRLFSQILCLFLPAILKASYSFTINLQPLQPTSPHISVCAKCIYRPLWHN